MPVNAVAAVAAINIKAPFPASACCYCIEEIVRVRRPVKLFSAGGLLVLAAEVEIGPVMRARENLAQGLVAVIYNERARVDGLFVVDYTGGCNHAYADSVRSLRLLRRVAAVHFFCSALLHLLNLSEPNAGRS